jgi:hypothetical protein
MTTSDATRRKEFFSSLVRARQRPSSFRAALWASRLALLQWVGWILLLSICFGVWWGQARMMEVLLVGFGLLLGFGLQLRQAVRAWPWWVAVIDWDAVEREMSRPDDEHTAAAP